MTSLSERFRTLNTLISLLKEVVGHVTTVELRKEASIKGHVDHVDEKMNMTMSDCVYTDIDGSEIHFDLFYVQGKNIRFVHIPDEINMLRAIQGHISGIRDKVINRQERKPRFHGSKQHRRAREKEFLEQKSRELMEKLGMVGGTESDGSQK